ncbi:FAD-dependent monooxygenase [Catellatospora sp. NPDC049609]|uniref:FAD-dependent monooxygenase n=1 Tax=Catellatospora sp. NPDC049609 TaxID=3155505 RepID=UPI0034189BC6
MRTVLISGAGIAGPALAYWLGRAGFRPTVVEIAAGPRTGGGAVDFRGAHLTVLERMGVLDELRRAQTGGSPMRFVDAAGRRLMELPADFAGGEVEVLRGDLGRILYEHSTPYAEYRFGDTVTALTQTADGVEVDFARGDRATYDLVVGADGVRSTVRLLAYGPHGRHLSHQGYYVATWEVPGFPGLGRTSLLYNEPGRMASIGGDHRDAARASAFVAFASPELDYDRRDTGRQRELIATALGGMGWHTPRLLAALPTATDLYFDAICRIDVTPWSRGRIALLGDAACGATIGGMGAGTAIVGAYVLAGELAAAGGDHTVAFGRYERLLRGYARGGQQGGQNTGRFLAPRRAWAARLRNSLLNRPYFLNLMLRTADDRTTALRLPDYPLPRADRRPDPV